MKRISTKPTKRLIQLSVIPLTFALAHALYALYLHLAGGQITTATQSMLNQAWGLIVFVLSAIALTDYFASRKAPKLELKRRCKDILSLHRWADVTLDIQSRTQQKTTHLVISELNDNALELSDTKVECEIKPDKATRLNYKVRANRRGDAYISGSHLLMLSDLKLWQSVWQVEHQSKFKVYPDFQAISGYTLLALDNNVSGFGIKRKPRRGEGMEFHQLREYQKGDTSRQIDWKATARKQKLISREYQEERDQQIIVLLDNGRRMRTEDEKLGHLDHAVNAMSLLSHIALKQGDAVGLMTFGTDQRWLPCQKGTSFINTILNHVYDLRPGTHATDYSSAAQTLVKLQRKRSLVILITNTRDEDFDDLMPAIKLIGKYHLILLANIHEPILAQTLDNEVTDLEQAYRYIGTIDYLNRREAVKQQITEAGVFMIDTSPANLPVEVCNSYLAIKRSGVL